MFHNLYFVSQTKSSLNLIKSIKTRDKLNNYQSFAQIQQLTMKVTSNQFIVYFNVCYPDLEKASNKIENN